MPSHRHDSSFAEITNEVLLLLNRSGSPSASSINLLPRRTPPYMADSLASISCKLYQRLFVAEFRKNHQRKGPTILDEIRLVRKLTEESCQFVSLSCARPAPTLFFARRRVSSRQPVFPPIASRINCTRIYNDINERTKEHVDKREFQVVDKYLNA